MFQIETILFLLIVAIRRWGGMTFKRPPRRPYVVLHVRLYVAVCNINGRRDSSQSEEEDQVQADKHLVCVERGNMWKNPRDYLPRKSTKSL